MVMSGIKNEAPKPAFTPEELGLGMWADDPTIGDSVEYVNAMRNNDRRSLEELLDDLYSAGLPE